MTTCTLGSAEDLNAWISAAYRFAHESHLAIRNTTFRAVCGSPAYDQTLWDGIQRMGKGQQIAARPVSEEQMQMCIQTCNLLLDLAEYFRLEPSIRKQIQVGALLDHEQVAMLALHVLSLMCDTSSLHSEGTLHLPSHPRDSEGNRIFALKIESIARNLSLTYVDLLDNNRTYITVKIYQQSRTVITLVDAD